MSKSKKIKVAGFDAPVNLKKKILKPYVQGVKTQHEAIRPGESMGQEGKKTFKASVDLIKKLAADGELTQSDLDSVQKFVTTSEGGRHYGEQMRSDVFGSVISGVGYQDYVNLQRKKGADFLGQQTGIINKALTSGFASLESQLGSLGINASEYLSGFKGLLDKSMGRLTKGIDRQIGGWDRKNEQTEARIDRYQDRITKLPKPPKKTKNISDKFTEVDAGDPYQSIAQNRSAVRVDTQPTFTGFNLAQQESRARQMQGLSGFRSKAA
jgi:hypothetical protein